MAAGKTVIVGQGYVGLPISMRAVYAGMDVIGLETDEDRLTTLRSGRSYVPDVSADEIRAALETGRFVPTAEPLACEDFDFAVITVPTPLKDGVPDLSFVEASAATLAPHLRRDATVILESTTYPGTTTELLVPVLESLSGMVAGRDFSVGYSPERIDPGNQRWNLANTPKVVAGIDARSLERVQGFYNSIVETTVPVSTVEVAELTKLLENTFRHVNIALVNELAMFAAQLDVDVWEAIRAASTKPFGFMPFTPGPGVGGHCLPVDPSYLSWRVERALGTPFRFVELANDINNHMPDYVAQRLLLSLNRQKKVLNGSTVLVLGLAYKKNSGDCREAPGPIVCERLRDLGAIVHATDPFVADAQIPDGVKRVDLSKNELSTADAVIIITDHDDFDWELVRTSSTYVFDTRHQLAAAPNVEFI